MSKETQKIRYEYLKAKKRCVSCAKRDDRTLSGKILCIECAAKNYALRKPISKAKKIEYRANARRSHAERKAAGLCIYCGQPAMNGYVRCEKHHKKQMEMQKKRREKRREMGKL